MPTPEGRLLYKEAEQMVLGLKALQRVAEGLRTTRAGRLHLVAIPALGDRHLPCIIARFLRQHPDAEVALDAHGSQIVNQWVAGQQVDLRLSLLNIEHPSVIKRTLCRVEAVAALPPGHRLVACEALHPADFAGERFISFTPETRMRHAIDQVFEAADVNRVQRIEAYVSNGACTFVAEGLGVALVRARRGGTNRRCGTTRRRTPRPSPRAFCSTL